MLVLILLLGFGGLGFAVVVELGGGGVEGFNSLNISNGPPPGGF